MVIVLGQEIVAGAIDDTEVKVIQEVKKSLLTVAQWPHDGFVSNHGHDEISPTRSGIINHHRPAKVSAGCR